MNGLAAAAALLEASSDSDIKFAKVVQKSYDSVNDFCAKSFKKISVGLALQTAYAHVQVD